MQKLLTLFVCLLSLYGISNAQSCTMSNLGQNTNNIVSGHTNAGQSFTASCTGNIVSVTVTFNGVPSTSSSNQNNRVLNIYDGGVCGSTLLHSQVIPINSIVLGPNVFTLTIPVPINLGEVNSWEISDATQSADAGYGVSFNGSGLYSGGSAWYSCSVLGGFDQTFEVQIGSGPRVNLGQDTTVCSGQSVVLDAGNPGSTYLWSTAATSQTITVNTAGTYWVAVSDTSGNTVSDTIVVSNFPTMQVNLGPDQNQCPGDTVCLNAGSGVGFVWNTGATTASICTTMPGIYDVIVTDSNGCSISDTVEVIAVPNPIVNLGPDQDICTLDSICLSDGSMGLTYLWNNGSTLNTLCTTMAGSYWLTTTDSNGCSASDSINITANQLAIAFVAGCDTANCPTIGFLDGSTNATAWAWDFGDGNTSPLQNPSNTYASNGSYQAMLTASNNCNSDTSAKQVVISCLISVEEGFSANVAIYPNPNQGAFNVSLSNLPIGNVELKLLTLAGQLLEARELNSLGATHNETFDVPNLSQGVYLLEITVAGKQRSEKIFIRK